MRIASVITPFTDENLKLASQVGVTDIVFRYLGTEVCAYVEMKERLESFGLRLAAIEGYLPIENIILGNKKRDDEIEEMKQLIANLASVGIPIICYNFMAGTDWVRTDLAVPERGGALVTAFNIDDVNKAMSLEGSSHQLEYDPISADRLWDNLQYFLDRIIPVAEKAGIALAMHPDDPPLDSFLGRDRIMKNVDDFERLVGTHASPSNAICFCQGTFAEMGADIPATIRRLGKHIRYVHFRDIEGTRERFRETFHDTGPTDMYAAIRAYRDIGFNGPIRPDHVPQLVGEDDGEPGYTMLGRLFAYGYMKGLIEAAGGLVAD